MMGTGVHVRIKRFPNLTGVTIQGSHHITYKNELDEEHTPPESRVRVGWDAQHGTPETTTIMEHLLEVIE